MKLNNKIYQTLTNPVEVQDANGKRVEIHYMNDTTYLSRYASRGQFSVWTSNGEDFRLLIEKGFYEEIQPLYSGSINAIWIEFFQAVNTIRNNLFRKIVLPVLGVAFLVVILFSLVPQLGDFRIYALLAMLVVVLFINIFQSSYMRKKVEEARTVAVTGIKDHLGTNQFQELVEKQNKYYENYFKFEEDALPEETALESSAEVVAEPILGEETNAPVEESDEK